MRLPTVSALLMSLSFLLPARRPAGAAPRPRRARPSVEALEDRAVPSANLGWAFHLGAAGANTQANAVATDAAGDTYAGGYLNGAAVNFDPSGGTAILDPTTVGGNMGYIAKYSASKALMWVIPTSTTVPTRVDNIVVDGNGDVYAKVFYPNPTGSSTATLAKYDPSGNLLWTTNLNQTVGAAYTSLYTLALDRSGNAYVGGSVSASLSNFVAKLDGSTGGLVWNKSITTGIGYLAPQLAVDGSGNVYATSGFTGTVDFDPGPGTSTLTSYGSKKAGYVEDAYVLELNSGGNFVWAGMMGTAAGTAGMGVAIDGSGNVYLTGDYNASSGSNDFDPGSGVHALAGSGTYVVKLNANHQFQWADGIGAWLSGSATNWSTSATFGSNPITVDAAGSVYLAGRFTGTADFDPGPGQYLLSTPSTNANAFVLKLDTSGNFAWAAAATGSSFSAPYGIAVDSQGHVYVVGSIHGTSNFDPNGTYNLTASGSSDAFVWQLTQS